VNALGLVGIAAILGGIAVFLLYQAPGDVNVLHDIEVNDYQYTPLHLENAAIIGAPLLIGGIVLLYLGR
jgi:hypothetical protein